MRTLRSGQTMKLSISFQIPVQKDSKDLKAMFVFCKYQTGEEIKGNDHLFLRMKIADVNRQKLGLIETF